MIVLARHGESEYSAVGLLNGDASVAVGLTARGREEARRLGAAVAAEPFELCVTTPFPRVVETADLALRARDVPRRVVDELSDPLYGPYEGGEIDAYRAWAASAPSSEPPGGGGESRLAIVERYARGFRELLALPERHVLVVFHSLPLSYALAARDGTPPAPRMPIAEHATPYPFTAAELRAVVEVLEQWAKAPTW